MTTTAPHPHAGLSCSQVEALVSLRSRQALDARQALAGMRAWLHRAGTPDEEIGAALAAVARVEAVARGDAAAARAVEPTSPWEAAIHAGTMLRALASLTRHDPDVTADMRRQLLDLAAGTDDEEDDDR